jgi:predicted MFS family arabinose efflux permease
MATLGFPVVAAFGAVPLIALPWMPQLGRRITASGRDGATPTPRVRGSGPPTPLLIWRSMIALVLATSAGGALLTFTTQLASDTGTAVLALVCLTASAAVCRWRFGALSDRLGTRLFLGPLLVVGAGGLVLVGLASGPDALIAGALVIGVAYGGLQSVTLVKAFADGDDRHRVSVAWNVGFDLGTGVGSAVVGVIAEQSSFRAAFFTLACACVLGAVASAARTR